VGVSAPFLGWLAGSGFLTGAFAWHFMPLSRLVSRQGFSNGVFAEKALPICVVTSSFTKIPALLARSAAEFGPQTAAVALLCEAFAR
jgi:hypothetical protein